MKSGISRLLVAGGVAVLLTSGCNVDPQQASQAAERVMTVAAQITPEAVETAIAASPINATAQVAAPAAPAAAPLVYARCITRGETAFLQLPQAGATQAAALSSRSIITAYGRTADATWVLGWDASAMRGWLPAASIGCTAPVEDLSVTDAGVLLTPTAMALAEVTTEATRVATVETTANMTATTTINVVTATPAATLEPTATEAPIPTQTAFPTTVLLPTALPTQAPLSATVAPTSPLRVITVVVTATPSQVRDLRCEVTPGTPVNLRNGPARDAKLLDTLPAGTRFLAQGRNEDASWLYGFTERQMPGWLIASSVECDGNPAQLVEVDR